MERSWDLREWSLILELNKFPCDYQKFKENIVKNRNSNFRVCRIDVPFVSRCKSRGYSKILVHLSFRAFVFTDHLILILYCFFKETKGTSVQIVAEHLSKVQISNDIWQDTEMRRSLCVKIVVQPLHVEITWKHIDSCIPGSLWLHVTCVPRSSSMQFTWRDICTYTSRLRRNPTSKSGLYVCSCR